MAEEYAALNMVDSGLFVLLSRGRDRVKLLYRNEDDGLHSDWHRACVT